MQLTTTLKGLCSYGLHTDDLNKLLTYLGKTEPDYDPLFLTTILESNGLKDALFALDKQNNGLSMCAMEVMNDAEV